MIGIIGIGSVGKNLLDSLIMKNPNEKFVIFDDDIVNANNIQYDKKYIGFKKTDSCKQQYSHNNILAITEFIDNKNLSIDMKKMLNQCDTIFDCRDTFERRTSFEAIKVFINKDKLIVDFRKNISFKCEVEGEYVSYISNSFIKSLISIFTKIWSDKKEEIEKYKNDDIAISINQIGIIEKLFPLSTKIDEKIEKIITKKKSLSTIEVNISDGLYNLMHKNFDLKEYNIKNIVEIIESETSHFPALYMIPSITGDNLNLQIINQTGGA